MKVVKIELYVQIRDDGEVVVMAIPHKIGEPTTASSKSTSTTTATTTATSKQSSSKQKSTTPTTTSQRPTRTRRQGESKRAFLIRRINELIQEKKGLREHLQKNDVNTDDLTNLTDKQLKRAISIALNYQPTQATQTENEDWMA